MLILNTLNRPMVVSLSQVTMANPHLIQMKLLKTLIEAKQTTMLAPAAVPRGTDRKRLNVGAGPKTAENGSLTKISDLNLKKINI